MVHDTAIIIGLRIATEFLAINLQVITSKNSFYFQVSAKVLITGVEKPFSQRGLHFPWRWWVKLRLFRSW